MNETKKTPRTLQAEASKNRIYEAAIKLIAEKGFEDTNIQDICAASGCSVGAFYHHFGSKDGILEENFRRADERFASFAKGDLPHADGRTRVVAYFGRYASLVANESGLDLSKRLYSCANKLFLRKGGAMQTELTAILAEAIEKGDLALEMDAEKACEWLFIGARGLAFHWCLTEGGFDLVEAMRDYARRSLRAIELRPEGCL
jgi:TetR/AcrR family fatty acid metabolism transcriptional regulator